MAAKLKVDQIESVDGNVNVTLNNSITMATGKTLPAASLTGALPAINGAALTGIVALPSQSGHSGKFLTTDATNASWATVTVPTNITSNAVDFGNWTITETGGVLLFATGGTNKMKLEANGNLTTVGNVTAYGSI
tara:strand:- start:74 stop:478 length:405 start_codon:yes stop_codon:yes gene_type:complete